MKVKLLGCQGLYQLSTIFDTPHLGTCCGGEAAMQHAGDKHPGSISLFQGASPSSGQHLVKLRLVFGYVKQNIHDIFVET